jgi:GNAT superfamily N-acetyltransferase
MILYRLAAESDLPALAQLRWDFRTEWSETPPPGKEEFLVYCTDFLLRGWTGGQWVYWIAEEEGQIISQVFVLRITKIPKPARWHDEFGYVTNVYTRPAYRNRGIGAQLMQQVIAWAQAEDLELLVLWPSERSVPFYERAGFSAENDILECAFR